MNRMQENAKLIQFERLTQRLPNGVIKRTDVKGDSAMNRLAAYEDTGYTPEEIATLKAENERLRAENAARKEVMQITYELHKSVIDSLEEVEAAMSGLEESTCS